MMQKLREYEGFFIEKIKEIMATDSVTGYTKEAIALIEKYADEMGYSHYKTQKGNLIIEVLGRNTEKTVGVSAHIDTIGAMVRSVNSDGTLAFTKIGGITLPTMDGEYCKIRTRDGKIYTGTFLSKHPAAHVFEKANSAPRDEDNMLVRIDERVKNKKDTQNLGICAGDFIFPDTKTTITKSGFLKSRFIDDKANVALIITILKYLKDYNLKPEFNTKMMITVYEETGHGASYLPSEISELLALDMGCIGKDLSCTEYDVSICAKDSSGPYDYDMVTKLVNLAKENNLNYAVDIYPSYGSDVSAALKGSNDIKGALIGMGVHASHGMERTHLEGVLNTMALAVLYMDCK